MPILRHVLPALLAGGLLAAPLAAQQPAAPPRPTNLQVLPDSISRDELIATMRGFALALGVRCSHCHVEVERDGRVERDMAADDKAPKRTAREMMRMVASINERLAALPERVDPPVRVQCATCHRGARTPRLLGDTLMIAYGHGGTDSLVATYRALRARHYGSGTYDFSDRPLADLGANLLSEGMPADATAVALLNVEVNPESPVAVSGLARAQLAAGDSAAALASLRRALALEPNNRDAAEAVQRLEAALGSRN